ncbi:MAG: hypothetical protein ABF260_03595 [Flavobacteriaceae bacterium]
MKTDNKLFKSIPLFLFLLFLLTKYVFFKEMSQGVYLTFLIIVLLTSTAIVLYNFKYLEYKNTTKRNKILVFSLGILASLIIALFH